MTDPMEMLRNLALRLAEIAEEEGLQLEAFMAAPRLDEGNHTLQAILSLSDEDQNLTGDDLVLKGILEATEATQEETLKTDAAKRLKEMQDRMEQGEGFL